MSSEDSDINLIKGNLVRLRDQLKETVDFYHTLCTELRSVEFLSSSVSLDYYDIKNTNEETFERLSRWRSLERKIFYTIQHHNSNKFNRSSVYEDKFLKALKDSKVYKNKEGDSDLIKNIDRLKEGIIAIKYSSEARRRVTNLSEFIARAKCETTGDGFDFWENMVILNGLCSWVREIVYDSSRATSIKQENTFTEINNGQSVYSNDVIKKVINFSKVNTKKRPVQTDHIITRKMLDITLNRKDLSIIDENMSRLHNSKNYIDSKITYYIFNLLEDIANGNIKSEGSINIDKLKFDFSPKLKQPLHVYDIQEYYSNFNESSNILINIHKIEQFFLKNASLSYSEAISRKIIQLLGNNKFIIFINRINGNSNTDITPSKRLIQSVLTAFRAAYFMYNPELKDLAKIWDKSPYPEICKT